MVNNNQKAGIVCHLTGKKAPAGLVKKGREEMF